jgi:hypothetical protein
MLHSLARHLSLLVPLSGAAVLQRPAKQVDTHDVDAAAVNVSLQAALHLEPLVTLLHWNAASAGTSALDGVPEHAVAAAAAAAEGEGAAAVATSMAAECAAGVMMAPEDYTHARTHARTLVRVRVA